MVFLLSDRGDDCVVRPAIPVHCQMRWARSIGVLPPELPQSHGGWSLQDVDSGLLTNGC